MVEPGHVPGIVHAFLHEYAACFRAKEHKPAIPWNLIRSRVGKNTGSKEERNGCIQILGILRSVYGFNNWILSLQKREKYIYKLIPIMNFNRTD
jgi:hypothetical protein